MKNFLIIIVFIIPLFFINCNRKENNTKDDKKEVKIGLITPLTGSVADLGNEILKSAEISIENANNLSKKYVFKLVPRDDGSIATIASTKAKSLLLEDNVIAIVGAGTTGQVKAEIEAIKGKNTALITSTATESDLTHSANFIFRVIPSNIFQAEALNNFALKNNLLRVGILYQFNDDYSMDLNKSFKNVFLSKGGQILSEIGFEEGETDFKSHLSKIKNMNVDAIICFSQHVQVSRVVLRARELKIEQPILSGETAYTDKLLATIGNSEGLYVTGLAKVSNTLLNEFEKKYFLLTSKNPGPYGLYTYDAISLICYVIENNNIIDNVSLTNELRKINNFNGLTGSIIFNEFGDVKKDYNIYKLINGKFEIVNIEK